LSNAEGQNRTDSTFEAVICTREESRGAAFLLVIAITSFFFFFFERIHTEKEALPGGEPDNKYAPEKTRSLGF
jgi:hypothetical protein